MDLTQPADALGDGYRVEAKIVLWHGDTVLKAPSSVFFPHDEGWAAFVIIDGKAKLRPVDLGHRGSREVEIVRGLIEGETVILHPSDQVQDGVMVQLRQRVR